MSMVEIALGALTPELERKLHDSDFGTALEGHGWRASIADRPLALRVDKMFQRLGGAVPATVDLYEGYDVWVIPNRFSIMRRGTFAEPTSIGIECNYLTDGATCSVVGLVPAPQFITIGGASGEVRCSGAITASGALIPVAPDAVGQDETTFTNGMRFSLGTGVDVHAQFSVVVVTRTISATGIGSANVQWQFEKDRHPLDGADIETWSVIVLPKGQREIEYDARLFLTMRTAFFPTRYESPWQRIKCEFVGAPDV
jgi:hypothetical protein